MSSYIGFMPKSQGRSIPLIHPQNLLAAIRDTGYATVAAAICELVDNAIEAEATEIAIEASPNGDGKTYSLSISDNGRGMDPEELALALQLGGSTRFNGRHSMGRFGMGLPAASLSLSRIASVYSRNSRSTPFGCVTLDLDVDESLVATTGILNTPMEFPWDSGTQVLLPRCDRVDYSRTGNLVNALSLALGRTYRVFLGQALNITINGQTVRPLDPLHRDSSQHGLQSTPFGQTRVIPFRIHGGISNVEIDFVELPIEDCLGLSSTQKRAAGISGGAVISVLRSGREIANGWFLTGQKRRENYDDWWRCEIRFKPDLDEYFGLTFTKQGIRPTSELRLAVESEIESTARVLNKRARLKFDAIRVREVSEETCQAAGKADRMLPPISHESRSKSGGTRYRIDAMPLESSALTSGAYEDGRVIISINSEHPMYLAINELSASIPDGSRKRLQRLFESLLVALVRTDLLLDPAEHSTTGKKSAQELWGSALSAIIRAHD